MVQLQRLGGLVETVEDVVEGAAVAAYAQAVAEFGQASSPLPVLVATTSGSRWRERRRRSMAGQHGFAEKGFQDLARQAGR